jgi:hypothetical protein
VKEEHADEGKAAHTIKCWEVGKGSGSLFMELRVSE